MKKVELFFWKKLKEFLKFLKELKEILKKRKKLVNVKIYYYIDGLRSVLIVDDGNHNSPKITKKRKKMAVEVKANYQVRVYNQQILMW